MELQQVFLYSDLTVFVRFLGELLTESHNTIVLSAAKLSRKKRYSQVWSEL